MSSKVAFVLVCVALAATGTLSRTSRNVVYFPDPKHEGKLIPAFLDGPKFVKAENETLKTQFHLITRNTADQPEQLFIGDTEALQTSSFIKGGKLKVFCHGFGGAYTDEFPRVLSRAYLEAEDNLNAILVDWSGLATSPWYNIAAGATKSVGQRTGEFVQFLVDAGYVAMEDVHIIGFSLGAHVAGATGAQLNGLAPRVTALDPALPLFDLVGDDERIDPTDGVFVDVLHTAGGFLWENGLAFITPRGDADFYPNSGRHQPGCEGTPDDIFGSCSHNRAPKFLTESITTSNGFYACPCESYELYSAGACDCSDLVLMGAYTPTNVRGSFWFSTASASPFALGQNGALP